MLEGYKESEGKYKLPIDLSYEISQEVLEFLKLQKGFLCVQEGFYSLIALGRKKLNAVPKELNDQLKEETNLKNLDSFDLDEYDRSSLLIDKALSTYSKYKRHQLVLTLMGKNSTFRFGFINLSTIKKSK